MLAINKWLMGLAIAAGVVCVGVAPASALTPPVDDLKIVASDPVNNDEFGSSVSILGEWLVVGSPRDNIFGANSGSAYLFIKDAGGLWVEHEKITPDIPMSSANFGGSVGMGDGFLVAGAPAHDISGMFDSGAAYAFEFDGDGWVQTQELIPGDIAAKEHLGKSVAVDGDVAVIGAPGDGFFNFVLGRAFVFRRGTQGFWTLEATLLASDAAMNDHFGISVAIDGDRIVVGADRNDDAGSSSGSAYVFEKSATNGQWNEVAKLVSNDAAGGDQYGNAVGVSGELVAVGAFRSDSGALANTGAVYLYERGGSGAWPQIKKLTAGNDLNADDAFGLSVAIKGTTLFVGAPTESSPLISAGRVYVFEDLVGAGWVRTLKLEPRDGEAGDFFGDQVVFDGLRAVVGSRWDDTALTNDGSATVYSFVAECFGDLNGDGAIDAADLGVILASFGADDPNADLNGDGIVDAADLGLLLGVFGQSCN